MKKAFGCVGGCFLTMWLLVIGLRWFVNLPSTNGLLQTRLDCIELANGIISFYIYNGYYPIPNGDGIAVDRKLVSALMGNNPRNTTFVSFRSAHKKWGKWVDGLNPDTGAMLDPYGNPYMVKVDADYDGKIYNPYRVNAGPPQISASVIVWSAAADGIFGNPKSPGDYKSSYDILSWQENWILMD